MIDLRSLEVFVWVARLGGFGRAAEALHTTQPAVSARVAALEADVGHRLFARGDGNRRPVPTAKGVELLAYAGRMLALRDELLAAMRTDAAGTGLVRLGVSETIVQTWLSAFVARLHAEMPELRLDIVVDISPALRDALLAGAIDVAFLLGPVAVPGASDRPLCAFDIVWAARPDVAAGIADLADLARIPVMTFPRATAPYRQLADLFSAADLPGARLSSSGSISSIARMAMDGIGVAVLPLAAIAAELADGRLVRVAAGPPLSPLVYTASVLAPPSRPALATVVDIACAVAAAWP